MWADGLPVKYWLSVALRIGLSSSVMGSSLISACGVARGGSKTTGTFVSSSMDASSPDAARSEASVEPSFDGSADDGGTNGVPDPRDVVIGFYAERRAFRTVQQVTSAIFSDDIKTLTTNYAL